MKRIGLMTGGLLSVSVISLMIMITNPVMHVSEPHSDKSADPDALRRHVDSLAMILPPRSYPHIESLDRTATYIESVLRGYTDRVELQKFFVNGDTFCNVSALFGPANGSRIVIGAHYDVCGDQPGADDNASGVAGALEIARLLSQVELKRPVEVVAYALEEPPHFRTQHMGSAHHAKKLHDERVPVLFMLSLECIGYFSDNTDSQSYPIGLLKWFYPDKANFVTVVGNISGWGLVREMKSNMRAASSLPVESINAPSFIRGVDFSDHLNYWKVGFDAMMITNTAFFRNANYHEITDTPDTLDYEKMAEVVKGVFYAVTAF